MTRYPLVTPEEDERVNPRGIGVETLSEQLIPLREVFITLFDGASAKGRGELLRVELGLAVSKEGYIGFATGTTKPSITLTFERRPRSPSTRSATKASAAKKPDVVEID